MKVKISKILTTEIFKTENNINPNYIKDKFKLKIIIPKVTRNVHGKELL